MSEDHKADKTELIPPPLRGLLESLSLAEKEVIHFLSGVAGQTVEGWVKTQIKKALPRPLVKAANGGADDVEMGVVLRGLKVVAPQTPGPRTSHLDGGSVSQRLHKEAYEADRVSQEKRASQGGAHVKGHPCLHCKVPKDGGATRVEQDALGICGARQTFGRTCTWSASVAPQCPYFNRFGGSR